MRTLLYAIPALLALAGTALAEPQQLDEAQLGGIAAGQDLNVATSEFNTTSTATSLTNTSEQILGQSLGSMSTNTVYATGVNSSNVNARGGASTDVVGSILP